MYKSYVRPVLEYASQVWSASGVTLSCSLERVQRKFTKRLRGAFGLDYELRLVSFILPTFKTRQLFHDMVFAFETLHVEPVDIGAGRHWIDFVLRSNKRYLPASATL